VKQWEIEQAQAQIIKIRASLNDDISPASDIKRPRYPCGRLLERIVFETRVNKLIKLENHVDKLLTKGLLKWFNRSYRL
jgi:hypothetical protein